MIRILVFLLIALQHLCADEAVTNHFVRPKAQLTSVDIFAEALYLYTSENVDWAFTHEGDANAFKSVYKTFVFEWAPGFRVGLGYNMEHDQWDTQASYTWFQSKASGHTHGPVEAGFLAARLSLLEPFSSGRASINLHYNILDWDLGRASLVSKNLIIRPSIGIKGGWIEQSIHSHWSLTNFFGPNLWTSSEKLKQHFKGIGPKGGAIGKWCFGDTQKQTFSLIGQFEAAYLWGHWSIHDRFDDSLSTVIYLKTLTRNFGSFVLHGFFGFGWDSNFNRDRSHFALKFGYEIEDWFNQLQIFTNTSGSQNNDLILQGLNLSLRADF